MHHEQGFGDTIQFCRFVPLVTGAGRIILEVPKPLVRLVSTLAGGAQIISRGDALPAFDLHCPMLSLPAALNIGFHTIPRDIPYLHADADQSRKWRDRLATHSGLRVGIAWAGSRGFPSVDRKRSIPLATLRPLLAVPGTTVVSLQKDVTPTVSRDRTSLLDWTRELRDFADTAALIEALDLVISVDTAVAHLAGALGKPVWVLNRFETCWRWLLNREDSPWYPSLRLFRQTRPGDWTDVIGRVRAELQSLTASRGPLHA